MELIKKALAKYGFIETAPNTYYQVVDGHLRFKYSAVINPDSVAVTDGTFKSTWHGKEEEFDDWLRLFIEYETVRLETL